MAFGSSRTVAQRDVEFNVNLGQFRTQLGEAASVYSRTTGAMSTEALRLTTRQYELSQAIQRHGAESVQAARKTIVLREEMERLAVASRGAEGSLLAEERALGRFSRGALAAAGISSELKRALLLGSGSFVVGIGLTALFKESIDAAKGLEVAQGQLRVSLKDSGDSWNQYGATIQEALGQQVKATAFNEKDLTATLAQNVRAFGNVQDALRANALTADVARAKNISLQEAQDLLQKAVLGQSSALRRLGIDYTKTTANTDALKASTKYATDEQKNQAKAADAAANQLQILDVVSQKFHGNAARYLQTSAGKQALFNAELERSKEIIGAALLPAVNRMLDRLSVWLDRMNRTGKLQRDVNTVVREGGHAFHDLGEGMHAIEGVVKEVDGLVGGFKHTVELLTAALIAFKTRGAPAFVIGSREIGGAAGAAAGASGVVARVGAYTGAGAAGAAAGSALGGIGFLGRLGLFGLAVTPDSGHTTHLGGPLDVTVAGGPGRGEFITYRDPINGSTRIITTNSGTDVGAAIKADLLHRYPYLSTEKAPTQQRGLDSPRRQFGGAPVASTSRRPGRNAPLVLGLTNAQQTALLRAEGTAGTGDDLVALHGQLDILNRLIQQPGLNAAQLNSLLSERDSVISQIQSIDSGTARHKKSATSAALRRQQEAFRSRETGFRTAETRAAAADIRQSRSSGITTHAHEIARDRAEERFLHAYIRDHAHDLHLRQEANSRLAAVEKHLAEIEKNTAKSAFAKEAQTFLEQLSGAIRQYAPNIQQSFTYEHPPTDPHAAAKHQRTAARAAFN